MTQADGDSSIRLMRLGEPGLEIPAVMTPTGEVLSLAGLTDDIDGKFLARGGIDEVEAALARGSLPELEGWRELRIGSPIAQPSAVICIGMNYAAHARESGASPPESPVVFLKHPNTVIGPHDDIEIPPNASQVDWEAELGVVIGERASYLASPADATAHIAGYVASNDVSERDFQLRQSGGQWSKGKCCPTFNPLGPFLVPTSSIDATRLRIRSWVNGAPRQDSSTSDQIFDVHHLVWHLSHYMTLEPGDLINTGTPEGVALSGRFPYLRPDDTVTIAIDGLGRQEQRVRKAHVITTQSSA